MKLGGCNQKFGWLKQEICFFFFFSFFFSGVNFWVILRKTKKKKQKQRFFFSFNIIFEIFQLVVIFTNYVANQHLEILKLKFKGGIRVSKTRFVCDGKLIWKKIYVEIEYLKLDFLCGTRVLKTQVPLEHQNRNTKNTRTETRRNNQQIRRNTKEQQI